jgi:uncharacterized protein
MSVMDRRQFLGRGAAAAGGGLVTAAALQRLQARAAFGDDRDDDDGDGGYGPLAPVAEAGADGREILALPAGFSYVVFGKIGSTMTDGTSTPLALDGMAAFRGPRGTIRLIRNHEDRNVPGSGSVPAVPGAYDDAAHGGTTTLDYDPRTRTLVRDFVSLSGTTTNCAGGYGLEHQSWLSGEELVGGPAFSNAGQRFPKRHGYLFEVPLRLTPGEPVTPEPLRAMGRFSHEACTTDQRTGIVYETEDPGSGQGAGFYRFIPDDPSYLSEGGRLQMLALRDEEQADLRDGRRVGDRLRVRWVDVVEPDPEYLVNDDPGSVFNQGFNAGGAKFNRLEGCWWGDRAGVFFASTSGGDVKNGDVNPDGYAEGFGQIWNYRPSRHHGGTLRLVYQSTGAEALDSPDNLCITPRGGLILCEDDASGDGDTHPAAPGIEDVNRLIGFSRRGEVFEFAVNRLNGSELAGATFSPDGRTLFFNLFGRARVEEPPNEGMTVAVTGPWERGSL